MEYGTNNRESNMPYSRVSFRSDIEWLSAIFSGTKHARPLCDSWASCQTCQRKHVKDQLVASKTTTLQERNWTFVARGVQISGDLGTEVPQQGPGTHPRWEPGGHASRRKISHILQCTPRRSYFLFVWCILKQK